MRTTTSLALMTALSAAGAAGQIPVPKPKPGIREVPIYSAQMPWIVAKSMQPSVAVAPKPHAPVPMPAVPMPHPEPVPMPLVPAPEPPAIPMPGQQEAQRGPKLPPEAVGQDPADGLWNQARAEMNRQNYRRAAELFQRLIQRYSRSEHVPNAYYWAAFSLYKRNATSDLKEAKQLLERQRQQYPRASTRNEAEALLVRINGELASRGDAESAQVVAQRAVKAAAQPCPESEDEEVRAAALSALMRMGSENTLPLLRQIMARRDACSAELRRNTIYMMMRQDFPEREALLLEALKSDPDPEVKKAAVFWMSRSASEKAVDAIQEVMRTTTDTEMQQIAVHALSLHPSSRASQVLREIAGNRNADLQVRQAAILWLGRKEDPASSSFLRSLFASVDEVQLKESILHIMSRRNDAGTAEWLLSIARDRQQPDQIRKSALFWASQGRAIASSEFARLYDLTPDSDMKQQIMYSLSRRNDSAAIEKLIDIARRDRDPELRKTAIFWLGLSKDPRAIRALQQIAGG